MSLLPIPLWQRSLVVLLVTASLGTILWLVAVQEAPVSGLAVAGYAAKVALLLAPLACLGRSAYWLHPLIFIGIWSFIRRVLPEASLILSGIQSHPGLPYATPEVLASSLNMKFSMDCLSIGATYVGFVLAGALPAPRLSHGVPRTVSIKLLVVAAISFAALMVLAGEAGGLDALALQRGMDKDDRVLATIGGGHWHFLVGMLGPVVLVAAALMHRPFRSPILLLALCLALAGRFLSTGSRGGTLSIVVMLFFILAARRGRIKVGRTLIFGLAVAAVIAVMTEFRQVSGRISSVAEFEYQGSSSDLMSSAITTLAEYSNTGNNDYPIYALIPTWEPLLLGESYVSVLTAPIPRAIWPGKPRGTGRLASDAFISEQAGVPPSAVGEAFWNFHVPGVLIVFLAWGVFLRIMWKAVASSRLPGIIALYVLTLYYLQPYTDAIIKWMQLMVPGVLVLMWFTFGGFRLRQRAVQPAGPGARSTAESRSPAIRGTYATSDRTTV